MTAEAPVICLHFRWQGRGGGTPLSFKDVCTNCAFSPLPATWQYLATRDAGKCLLIGG